MNLDWTITLCALGGGVFVSLLSIWQSGRPRRDSIHARWIPWRFLVLLGAAVALTAAVHVVTLFGLRPQPG